MVNKKENKPTELTASGAVNLNQVVQYLSTWKGTE